jgi:hypothetical protein
VDGSCEHGKEPPGCIKCREVFPTASGEGFISMQFIYTLMSLLAHAREASKTSDCEVGRPVVGRAYIS